MTRGVASVRHIVEVSFICYHQHKRATTMPSNPKRSDNRIPGYVWLFLAVGVILVSFAVGIIWAISDEVSLFARLGSDVANIAAGVGVAIAGGGFLAWRSIAAEKQLDKSQTQIEQMQASNRNQTWKGSIELLANDKSATARIGGVESLYQVAIENPNHYGSPATKILKDFIRERLQALQEKFYINPERTKIPYEVYYAIDKLKGIHRKINNDKSKCELTDFKFNPLNINSNDAEEVNLLTNLFEGLSFKTSAFSTAKFTDINIKDTVFSNCGIRLSHFFGCDFTSTNFRECDLSCASFESSQKNPQTSFKNTTFYDCELTNADFSKTKGLTKKSFRKCYYYHPRGNIEDGKPTLPESASDSKIEPREASESSLVSVSGIP